MNTSTASSFEFDRTRHYKAVAYGTVLLDRGFADRLDELASMDLCMVRCALCAYPTPWSLEFIDRVAEMHDAS